MKGNVEQHVADEDERRNPGRAGSREGAVGGVQRQRRGEAGHGNRQHQEFLDQAREGGCANA